MKKKTSLIIVSIVLLAALFFLFNILGKPEVVYSLETYDENGADITVDIKNRNIFNRNHWICIDNNPLVDENSKWDLYADNKFHLESGTYYIHVKDDLGHIVNTDSIINSTLNISIKNNLYPFYPIGEAINLDLEVLSIGQANETIITSSNENVVSIEGNTLRCKEKGNRLNGRTYKVPLQRER